MNEHNDLRGDIGLDTDHIKSQIAFIAKSLKEIESLPTLQHRPDHYVDAFERGGQHIVKNLAYDLTESVQRLETITRSLSASQEDASINARRPVSLWVSAWAGVLFGVLITLALQRLLPPPPPPAHLGTSLR